MAQTPIAHSPFPSADPEVRRARRRLRHDYRRRRRLLDQRAQKAHAEAVARHFFARALNLRGRTIGVYVANDGELDPAPLIERLLPLRRRLALPVVGRAGTMDFFRLRRTTRLIPNRFGIPEPAPGTPYVAPLSIDLLLIPLVAFDQRGMRLGMGAGFYDRFVGRLPVGLRPRLIGLAHEVQRAAEPLPAEPWDVPLDGVLTEAGWFSFTKEQDPWP